MSRSYRELALLYGPENVREYKGRLQVYELHKLIGGNVHRPDLKEWVEEAQAAPPPPKMNQPEGLPDLPKPTPIPSG
jgi:hypothetical protein